MSAISFSSSFVKVSGGVIGGGSSSVGAYIGSTSGTATEGQTQITLTQPLIVGRVFLVVLNTLDHATVYGTSLTGNVLTVPAFTDSGLWEVHVYS